MALAWETVTGVISSTYLGTDERKMGNDINIISFIEHKNLTMTAAAWSSVESVPRMA